MGLEQVWHQVGVAAELATDRAALASDGRMERMDRVAVLYGEITAATREFLRALAEVDRESDYVEEGFGTCAEWLAWRIGVTRNTANEKVRAARALERLPRATTRCCRCRSGSSRWRRRQSWRRRTGRSVTCCMWRARGRGRSC